MLFEGIQSALNAQGADARVIAEITWVLFIGAAVIFLAVMALAWLAVFKKERRSWLGTQGVIVGGGIVFPLVTLAALLLYSLARANALTGPADEPAVRIEVVGEQWWWRVHYLDAAGRRDFATANEIRVPAGATVELALKSADVIHSFWVPALAGKLDMIPGRTNLLRLRAERPGQYRGQCAEYCGGPHAFMAFFVVAQEPADYERWASVQRGTALAFQNEFLLRGKGVFEDQCAGCHTIRGTAAAGVRGPDLTHVGSRLTIGAGLLPMNAGSLAGWIASSQHQKPGNLMPSFTSIPGEDLRALSAYLEALK